MQARYNLYYTQLRLTQQLYCNSLIETATNLDFNILTHKAYHYFFVKNNIFEIKIYNWNL